MQGGSLTVSVLLYAVCATVCLIFLVIRRHLPAFGKAELGGPANTKYFTGAFFILLWFVYVILSSLVPYELISGNL